MKVARELQRAKLNADGYAPIRLVVIWRGKRLRVGTGCPLLAELPTAES